MGMTNTQAKKPRPQSPKEDEREGIVVWDQKGLVVLWPDGHCSRFAWTMLRQACQCTECRPQKGESAGDANAMAAALAPFSPHGAKQPLH